MRGRRRGHKETDSCERSEDLTHVSSGRHGRLNCRGPRRELTSDRALRRIYGVEGGVSPFLCDYPSKGRQRVFRGDPNSRRHEGTIGPDMSTEGKRQSKGVKG